MLDVARILKSFLNSLSALVQKRPHHPARWARICSPPERGRCLSVSTVLRQTDPLLLLFSCWPNRNDAPRAWRRSCHGQPGCRAHLRLAQSRLPWQRLWLELSRSFLIALLWPASLPPPLDPFFCALDAPRSALLGS